jgi:hypothetical protein
LTDELRQSLKAFARNGQIEIGSALERVMGLIEGAPHIGQAAVYVGFGVAIVENEHGNLPGRSILAGFAAGPPGPARSCAGCPLVLV